MAEIFESFFGDFSVASKVTSCSGRLEGKLFLRYAQNKSKTFLSQHFDF